MLIDWFTVIAQMINFLFIIWILKSFLYKPVLEKIDERRKNIDLQIKEAQLKIEEAQEQKDTFEQKIEEFNRLKAEKTKKAEEEIEKLSHLLSAQAKEEVEKQKVLWLHSLENEKEDFYRNLKSKLQKEVFSLSKQALADLAETSLEECIINNFLMQLKSLAKNKEELASLLSPSHNLQVRTALELTKPLMEKIHQTIQQEYGKEFQVEFIVVPDLVAGIELLANGKKLSWNVADYLVSLENLIDQMLVEKEK